MSTYNPRDFGIVSTIQDRLDQGQTIDPTARYQQKIPGTTTRDVPTPIPTSTPMTRPEIPKVPPTINPPVLSPGNIRQVELPVGIAEPIQPTTTIPRPRPVAPPTSIGDYQAVLNTIDPSRLTAERTRNSYTVNELKEFARRLNLRTSGRKADLVERIREVLETSGNL